MTRATLFALVLGGCGQDICARRADIASSCGLEFTDSELQTCHEAHDTCSKEEKVELKSLYECLKEQGYEDCDPGATGSGPSFNQIDAFVACEDSAASLSDSCLESVGVGAGTTFQ